MSSSTKDLIPIIAFHPAGDHEAFALMSRIGAASAQKVSRNLVQVVEALQRTMAAIPDTPAAFEIEHLTFSLTADAEGKIALVGELAAGMTAGMTITFRRRAGE